MSSETSSGSEVGRGGGGGEFIKIYTPKVYIMLCSKSRVTGIPLFCILISSLADGDFLKNYSSVENKL